MPFIDSVLKELERESASTVRILERVPYDKLDWSPHPKSMTLGELAWHIAGIPKRVGQMLREGVFEPKPGRPAGVPAETGAIAEGYRQNIEDLKNQIVAMGDEALREAFSMQRGGQTVMQIPKTGVVRSILLNHTYHHRGQLSVYLRLLDVPVPAMYGVSADEGF
ncbi:MAG TPA: DinB family protein [Thermoanaerobaculia bacterium]|nr:DinB family protein [Thermoanaerobaculia bacterium]